MESYIRSWSLFKIAFSSTLVRGASGRCSGSGGPMPDVFFFEFFLFMEDTCCSAARDSKNVSMNESQESGPYDVLICSASYFP